MPNVTAAVPAQPRRLGRSVVALLAGFVVVVVLSLSVDEVLHVLKVYPPWGEPMYDPGLNLLAMMYRAIITVVGGYVTARLAPYAPMRHAAIGAGIGLVLGTLGVIGAMNLGGLGPLWYPIGVAVTGPLCNLVGGAIYVKRMKP